MSLPTSREFITRLLNSLPAVPQSPEHGAATTIGASNPLNSAPEATKKQLLALHVLFPNEFLPALDLLDRCLVTRFRIRDNLSNELRKTIPQIGNSADSGSSSEAIRRGHLAENEVEILIINEEVNIEQRGEVSAQNCSPARTAGPTDNCDTDLLGVVTTISESQGLPDPLQVSKQGAGTAHEEVVIMQEEERRVNDTVYYVRSAQQRSSRFSTSYDSITSYEVRLNVWNCSCPAFAFVAFPSAIPSSTFPSSPSNSNLDCRSGSRQNGHTERHIKEEREEGTWNFGGVSLKTTTPVCKHLLACVLVERVGMFGYHVEEKDVSCEEAAGWAAGWGD